MILKSSIAAVALVAAVVSLSRVDYRELYDEMYPVNGLRRDVLHLCQDVKPTFVRALETDRVGCYDSMPDPVERAIGWVRTTSRMALMRHPTAVEQAEKLLVEATMPGREDLLAPRRFTGYVTQAAAVRPCKPTVLAAVSEAAATTINRADEPALEALGVVPRRDRAELRSAGFRQAGILPLGDAAVGAGDAAAGLLDPALGDSAPLPPSAGCRTPA